MNELQIFQYEQNDIRTVLKNGEPWFAAVDVCRVLDIQNSTQSISRLDDDEVTMLNIGSLSGNTYFINEPGLYSLILGSRKPEAKAFKRWITHEVIPAIRKTGTYTAQPMSQIELLQASINILADQEKRMTRLENKVQAALEKPVIVDWCKWINDKVNYIVEANGLNHHIYRGDLYRELEETAHCNLDVRLSQKRKRLKDAGCKYSECQKVNKLHIINDDPKLKIIFEGIVKRESARSA